MSDPYKYEGKSLAPDEMKARMATQRNKMTEQDAIERGKNFSEVNLGYKEQDALAEAQRCLLCKIPQCVKWCPVQIKVPEFIDAVAEGDFLKGLQIVKEDNALPAVTGRVCPQEIQCEGKCTQGRVKTSGGAVAIGHLERFVADLERNSEQKCCMEVAPPTGKKVAIIGSGPGGLTAAADLARFGHEVHVYEALHQPGGVLVYGIPEFRLPKEIVNYEIDGMKQMGVQIHCNYVIGKIFTIQELFEEKKFDAIYVGIGAGLPRFMRIPGENLNGVYSANEYLTRSNLMKAYDFPNHDTPIRIAKKCAVIGGGNVAMDSARTALRLGGDEVYIVYRRSMEEMPARVEEVHHAQEEGIKFDILTNPIKIIGDENGWVKQMECIRMELGEPDDSGRRRPVPIEGSNFILDVDQVVIAIGAGANPLLTSSTPDIALNRWGYIVADQNGRTSMPGVWAGGDIVTGAATVILAMGAGKEAAADINEWLKTGCNGWECGEPQN
jgi:glutamate synthase (NADPH/NADH) small chain